jgi:FMN reductase (NADPH)
MLNKLIETIQNHRSIRHYEDRPLTDEQIKTIVQSAQSAATSSFVQAYTIIGVKDKEKKRKLAQLSGNQHVENNGHLLVFCADLHRHELISEMEGIDFNHNLETTENFMIALIDTALAAQNAALAAESLGLGICYIGGLRNNLEEVSKVLNIPKYVIPLFGMTIGYPLNESDKKPRLPYEHIYHEDEYQSDSVLKKQLEDYNKTVQQYYIERTNGKRKDTWTSQMAAKFKEPNRAYMKDFVQKQGFNKI